MGILLTIWLKSDITITRFAEDIPNFCEKIGGNLGRQDNGREYCVFWVK